MKLFNLLLLLLLVKCTTTPVSVPDIFVPAYKSAFPNAAWTAHALSEVKKSKLHGFKPVDGKEFCPVMSDESYVGLISAMAKFESNFKPETEYKENFKDTKGNYIISTGLLQISLESSKGYGCGMTSQADLKDPLKNISCAVKILERWIVRDGRIAGNVAGWKGASRYWSTMRGNSLKKTQAVLTPFCE